MSAANLRRVAIAAVLAGGVACYANAGAQEPGDLHAVTPSVLSDAEGRAEVEFAMATVWGDLGSIEAMFEWDPEQLTLVEADIAWNGEAVSVRDSTFNAIAGFAEINISDWRDDNGSDPVSFIRFSFDVNGEPGDIIRIHSRLLDAIEPYGGRPARLRSYGAEIVIQAPYAASTEAPEIMAEVGASERNVSVLESGDPLHGRALRLRPRGTPLVLHEWTGDEAVPRRVILPR